MMYQGGKYRVRKPLAALINTFNPKIYMEPFCGSCSVGFEVNALKRIFSDLREEVIAFWNAATGRGEEGDAWKPPTSVTEAEYEAAKKGELPLAETGFILTNCAFGGKWGSGYARMEVGVTKPEDFPARGIRTMERDLKKIKGTDFSFIFSDYRTMLKEVEADVIYCDPPYEGTAGYNKMPPFNHNQFWDDVRERSQTSVVLVSEYKAPDDFMEILAADTYTSMSNKPGYSEKRKEKLFQLRTAAEARALQLAAEEEKIAAIASMPRAKTMAEWRARRAA